MPMNTTSRSSASRSGSVSSAAPVIWRPSPRHDRSSARPGARRALNARGGPGKRGSDRGRAGARLLRELLRLLAEARAHVAGAAALSFLRASSRTGEMPVDDGFGAAHGASALSAKFPLLPVGDLVIAT